jgi:serine/threonine-protein kinase
VTLDIEHIKSALADRYDVEKELGSGELAVVYLARDLKHDRPVAVKVLRPEVAASVGVDRFLREVQVGAKLNHPNILPLYDSGEAEGFLYYVMPYIEGEWLAGRLRREQQLRIPEAVQIAREVADGLSYAHSHGLVHRDIKPDNIMLSAGHATVAGFGFARAIFAAGEEDVAQPGSMVGTPAYMSPEQAAGGEELDGRSDIYSLGCVLYEMLVGEPPFSGPTSEAVMARHTLDSVPAPHIVRQTIPEGLEEVILYALNKAPADRFRTAAEFAEALAPFELDAVRTASTRALPVRGERRPALRPVTVAWSAVAVLGLVLAGWWFGVRSPSRVASGALDGLDPSSIAVLYFDDLSADRDLQYAADGLTEGLIDQLSRVRALNVISRNGVARFRNEDVSRDSIARALNVGSLIEGSVAEVGDRMQIMARLIDGSSGADVERTSFEVPAGEFLTARDSVAQEMARLLRARLGAEVQLRQRRASTASLAAWSLVQQAERLRKNAEALREQGDDAAASREFHRADSLLLHTEEADPDWLEPIVLRGWVSYDRSRLERGDGAVPWLDAALRHGQRALALAPEDAAALELCGTVRYRHWDLRVTPDVEEWEALLESARENLEVAVRVDPTRATANLTLTYLYYQIDDVPAALLAARRAYEEDAYLSAAADILGRLYWGSLDLEQFAAARRWCAEGARRFPGHPSFVECRLWLMATPAMDPDVDLAWQLLAKLDTVLPQSRWAPRARTQGMILVGGTIARAGLADSARQVLLQARVNVTHDVDPTQTLLSLEAYMRTHLGDHDEAIDLLKRYVAANPDHPFAEEAGTAWWWRELRNHPRFKEIS